MSSSVRLRQHCQPLGDKETPDVLVNQKPGENRRIGDPLEVQAIIMDGRGGRLVLIGADIIWFSDAIADALRQEIADRAETSIASVSLAATHTHGSPQPDARFHYGTGKAFADTLFRTVIAAVDAALAKQPRTVRLVQGHANCATPLAISRRRKAWHITKNGIRRRVQNLPNLQRPADNGVTVLAAVDAENRPLCVITRFTCHPVTDPPSTFGSDYPGALRQRLRQRLGAEIPCLFLQGYCGDIRPNLIHKPAGLKDQLVELLIGPRFRSAHEADNNRFAEILCDAALKALDGARQITDPGFSAATAKMPLNSETGMPLNRDLGATVWRVGADCILDFANGEMLSGLASKDGSISVGYSNGMVGYVAPEEEYAGGGYEIDGHLSRFDLPERLARDTGTRFRLLRRKLMAESGFEAA